MRSLLSSAFACLLGAAFPIHAAEPDETGPVAVSGGAEIRRISISREKAAYAARKADLTHMSVELWLLARWHKPAGRFSVRLLELVPSWTARARPSPATGG